MDQFDNMLRERAKREPVPLPPGYAGRIFRTCAALEDTGAANGRPHGRFARWLGGLAAALAVFIAIPNVSPAAAAAMGEVPVLGAIVELITFRNYAYDDGHSAADVTVPELGGSAAAEQVSEQVREYTDQLLARFQADCETIGEGYQGLDVRSTVVTDSDGWFTLRVDAVQTQASGYEFSRFYHIDKAAGTVVTLKDLFREDADYVSVLSDEVRRQMTEQTAGDDAPPYFPEEFTAIDPNQNFYFNQDGQLVLVFDEYSVAAGSMGMPEFIMPEEVWHPLLAEEM